MNDNESTSTGVESEPIITVLLPVYNGMPHVRHAIESLREQSEGRFIAFVYDDGSTDATGAYLDSIDDPRFVIRHQANMGLAKTLNAMIGDVRTEYVARMDADDVCLPERFAKQLAFLESHPEVAVVGARQGYVAGERSKAEFNLGFRTFVPSYAPPMSDPPYWHPLEDGHILVHSSVMMRSGALREVGSYPEIVPGQDLALWYRFAETRWRMASLEEMLVLVRISEGGISSKNLSKQYHTWCHIADSWRRKRDGEPAIDLDAYMREHPLSEKEISAMTAKVKLRNALARCLEGRWLNGLVRVAGIVMAHPSLFLEKLRARLH